MRRFVLALGLSTGLVVAGLAGSASAEPNVPPARCFATPEKWAFDRDAESSARPGERFLADMRECDPTLAANITEAVRYQIQSTEADTFARHKLYVLAAYGAAWAFLALAGFALWIRQRNLDASIAALTARLRASAANEKSA